jgi:hypothetical protein
MADLKSSPADQIEDCEIVKSNLHHNDDNDTLPYPESLQNMSEEAITQLGKKTTLKMDLIVMPALVIMYILNYLGIPPFISSISTVRLTMCRQTKHRSCKASGYN